MSCEQRLHSRRAASICPSASVGLGLPVPASVVFGGPLTREEGCAPPARRRPGQAPSAWCKGGRPLELPKGRDRAQTHLFGIRHELSIVGQKLASLSQRAELGDTAKCLRRASSPLEILFWSLHSWTRFPFSLVLAGLGDRHEETLSLPCEGGRREMACWAHPRTKEGL